MLRVSIFRFNLDIKYNKFTKDILKFVAPHFNFDTVRMAEEQKLKSQNDIDGTNISEVYDINNKKNDESMKPKKVVKSKNSKK